AQQIAQLHGQQAYIVKASRAGVVSNLQAAEGQQAQADIPVLSLVPENHVLTAQLLVPVHSAGFLSAGQPLKLRFDAFPYQKFDLYPGAVLEESDMQNNQLLAGTIGDNTACFEAQLYPRRIVHCAQLVHIHEEIMPIHMQYNTLMGEMGTSLSGGQKQRTVLARAVYRAPRILFMDEATSHLGVANESLGNQHIQQFFPIA
ncbi:ATP-binding cassette domain-containing protein, partial [uncultured Microbulbifer sp.]|uniref:ATP-binding cassette domain-containing protein n=1 Tax=uncultured Microbulbifer sp. TaxID=348147 RepID=UPI0026207A2A